MAREPTVRRNDECSGTGDNRAVRDGKSRLLHRRAYLRLAGATVVGASTTGVAVATAGEARDTETDERRIDYETITVPAGKHEVIHLDSGETFESVLFDQTAPGSAATIVAQGTDWTVRNVAWKGEFSNRERAFGVSDTGGGTSRIENVYLGDGVDESVGGARHPKFGLWVAPQHNGRLEIDRVYVADANDNGFYASAPGSNGNGGRGTVHFSNCYAKDCRVAGFRLAGGSVENCVGVNTGANDGRPLWVWPGKDGLEVEVRDSHFSSGSYPHGYDIGRSGGTTTVRVVDSHYAPANSTRFEGNVTLDEENVGHEPEQFVPDGCPDSPDAVFEPDGTESDDALEDGDDTAGQGSNEE